MYRLVNSLMVVANVIASLSIAWLTVLFCMSAYNETMHGSFSWYMIPVVSIMCLMTVLTPIVLFRSNNASL